MLNMSRIANLSYNLQAFHPKLAESWHPTKNGRLTPEDIAPHSNKKVWWRCQKRHEWQTSVGHRSRGQGCPYCSGHKVDRDNCLATKKPSLACEWHFTKNGSLTPIDVSLGSGRKVWWQCKKGHEWKAFINNRSKGIGCPYCSNKAACEDNCLATKNPELAKEWHPIKNGPLTPRDVLPSSNKKVWWRCKKGHEWITFVNNRSAGKSCPYCAGQKVCEDNCLATQMPALAKEWHLNKNSKLTPSGVLPGSDQKVWWKCKKNHEWKAGVATRRRGNGCPYCANKKTNNDNCLAAINPELAKEWHPSKNGDLAPTSITPGSNRKVWWQCKRGHEWEAVVSSRNAGTRCPKCCSATSQLELIVFTELKYLFATVQHRKKVFNMECDIYIPDIKCAIEIDGAYWHKNKEAKDREKSRALEERNIFLLRVRDYGLNKIAMQDILLPKKIRKYEVISHILNAIKNNKSLEKDCSDKIKKYLKDKKLKNQKEYKEISYMLPGPLPGKSLIETNPALAIEWHPTKNGALTAKSVTLNSNKKVWWLCNGRHEWESPVSNRSSGSGCPYCAGQKVTPKTSLAVKNPKLAGEWHPSKNGALTPENVMLGSGRKVWWQCGKGHEWEAKINNRNHGRNCPYCSRRRPSSLLKNQPVLFDL